MARKTKEQLEIENADLINTNNELLKQNDQLQRVNISLQQKVREFSNRIDTAETNLKGVENSYLRDVLKLKEVIRRLEVMGHTTVKNLGNLLHNSIDLIEAEGLSLDSDTRDFFEV
jgi:flagellar hook-length control protein FliK